MNKLPQKNQLTIDGTSGDDLLIGTPDADTINGLDGNDTLIGEGGVDNLRGGPGNDIYRAETYDEDIRELEGEGYDAVYTVGDYALFQGQEIELFSAIDPTSTVGLFMRGNQLSQTIIGTAGNDWISGNNGGDTLIGLAGDDTYEILEAEDIILEDAGGGNDTAFVIYLVQDYSLRPGWEVENLATVFPDNNAPLNLTGNEFANRITGSAGVNTLIGGGGNDILAGAGGGDFYRVEDIGDIVIESVANNPAQVDSLYVAMSLSGYVLADDWGIEVLGAIDPMLTIVFDLTGNAQANTLFGSAGQNTLIGGGGNDTLVGFAGNDFYRVEGTNDRVLESAGGGFDWVYAGFSYRLAAGSEVEVLATLEPTLTDPLSLTGNEFANEIYGNDGANFLDGKVGDDLLIGRAGADIFAFTVSADGGNVDTIGDFLAGTDKIGLDDSTFAGVAMPGTPGVPGPFNANAFVIGTAAGDADDRIIYDSATGRLFYDLDGNGAGAAYQFATLAGAPVLAASDFVVI
ncbi:MAG: hypothetical protein QOD42_3647 [Sphingomonadales bacterium]|jgi:Ca2+-binding RTX toxin-like protein|nr:hypothetical protein [Sphingomonadales bacterium]